MAWTTPTTRVNGELIEADDWNTDVTENLKYLKADPTIDSLTLSAGATLDEFSVDGTLAGNSDTAAPTEKAVKTYVDTLAPTSFSTFTPTLVQSGAVTKTVNFARYKVIGKICHLEIGLTVTGSGSAGNAITVGNIPAAAQWSNQPTFYGSLGIAFIVDTSVGGYTGLALPVSTSEMVFVDASTNSNIGANPSFGLAAGDIITINLSYEVA